MTKYSLAAVGVAFALLSVACTKTYIVQPATGGATAEANAAGLTLTAVPNAWNSEPSDLNEYLTPIWIKLENHQAETVRVVYSDIVLTDESGVRYAAISPYTGQPSVAVEPPSTQPPQNPIRTFQYWLSPDTLPNRHSSTGECFTAS